MADAQTAVVDESDTEAMTIEGAWAAYDLAEREMWEEYADDPNYVAGKIYLAGEQLMRRRCERRVQAIRYRQSEETHA
jgi:hypothetical protein